jgi:hypothetical protein
LKRGAGFKEVVVDDLSFSEGSESEIAFKTAEGSGAAFKVGPFAFKLVVVGLFKEGFVDEMAFSPDAEVRESADVAPEAVGEHLGFSEFRRGVKGHGESITSGLGVAARREIVAEIDVIARAIVEPEPAFLASHREARFISEDARLSPRFFRAYGERSAVLGEEERSFMRPTGDRVVRDGDVVDIVHGSDHGRGRHSAEEREVENEGHAGRRESHLVPVEVELDFPANEANLFGIVDQVKGVLSWQRDIDLVSAAAFSFGHVAIAAEAESIAKVFKDTHPGSTFRADDRGVFASSRWATRDELATAERVFAPVALHERSRIEPKAMDISATAWAEDIRSSL